MYFENCFVVYRGLLMIVLMVGISVLTLLLSSCRQQTIPLIEQKCGTCHGASIVYETRRTEVGWRQVMHGMKIRGMEITPQEEEQVFAILFREFLLK